MTPDQIAATLVLDWAERQPFDLERAPLPHPTVMDLTQAIATALRQARNEALEEAATLVETHAVAKPLPSRYGLVRRKTPSLTSTGFAMAIRALKHKDGQP